jgi:hypothetical protein
MQNVYDWGDQKFNLNSIFSEHRKSTKIERSVLEVGQENEVSGGTRKQAVNGDFWYFMIYKH